MSDDRLTDQELTEAAEIIIDRVAALRPDQDYEMNSLVWAVASYAVGLQSLIDEVKIERDRLRAVVQDYATLHDEHESIGALVDAEDWDTVRDWGHRQAVAYRALVGALDDASPPPPAQRILADYARDLEAERDRLRAVVEQALRLGETEGMTRGKMPYPDWWVLLDRALDPRERQLDVSPSMGEDSVGDDDLTVAVAPTDHRGAGALTSGAPSGVDPTSPTYDPDQYGTSDIGEEATGEAQDHRSDVVGAHGVGPGLVGQDRGGGLVGEQAPNDEPPGTRMVEAFEAFEMGRPEKVAPPVHGQGGRSTPTPRTERDEQSVVNEPTLGDLPDIVLREYVTEQEVEDHRPSGDRCTTCRRTLQECVTQTEDVGFGPMCCEDCSHLVTDVAKMQAAWSRRPITPQEIIDRAAQTDRVDVDTKGVPTDSDPLAPQPPREEP